MRDMGKSKLKVKSHNGSSLNSHTHHNGDEYKVSGPKIGIKTIFALCVPNSKQRKYDNNIYVFPEQFIQPQHQSCFQ